MKNKRGIRGKKILKKRKRKRQRGRKRDTEGSTERQREPAIKASGYLPKKGHFSICFGLRGKIIGEQELPSSDD